VIRTKFLNFATNAVLKVCKRRRKQVFGKPSNGEMNETQVARRTALREKERTCHDLRGKKYSQVFKYKIYHPTYVSTWFDLTTHMLASGVNTPSHQGKDTSCLGPMLWFKKRFCQKIGEQSGGFDSKPS
jgi:hypothetical protein